MSLTVGIRGFILLSIIYSWYPVTLNETEGNFFFAATYVDKLLAHRNDWTTVRITPDNQESLPPIIARRTHYIKYNFMTVCGLQWRNALALRQPNVQPLGHKRKLEEVQ